MKNSTKPDQDQDFTELAYFHNSYPITNDNTPAILHNLKITAVVVAAYELISFLYVGNKALFF
jgi:hypothetical protein